jgi:2-polyprenyl-3-methyl-5-hydroxy-6-metoxy-1,4-benzoquinol methylase
MFEQEVKILNSINLKDFNDQSVGESATLTYIHNNFLIRWLFLRRLYLTINLLEEIRERRPLHHEKVIDFGCGSGILLPALGKRFVTVYGIEIFPDIALTLKEKMPNDFSNVIILDKIDNLEDGQADAIIALDVLEHIVNVEPLLAIIVLKLSNNGILIISGPTENIFYSFLRKVAALISKGWFTGNYHHHNIEQLREIIGKNDKLQSLCVKSVPLFPPLFKIILYTKKD